MIKTKVVPTNRGKFSVRWNIGEGWKQYTTPFPSVETNRAKAYRILAQVEAELKGEIPPDITLQKQKAIEVPPVEEESQPDELSDLTKKLDLKVWDNYKLYFIENHLNALDPIYKAVLLAIVGKFESFTNIKYLAEFRPPLVRRWFTRLEKEGLENSTIHSYWNHLSSFLEVAVIDELLEKMPKVRLPKIDRTSLSKGRPLILEEFERLKLAAFAQRLRQAKEWEFILDGLWWSGLRIAEAYRITWDKSEFYVDMDRRFPSYVIEPDGQKNKKRQVLTIAPEFADMLKAVPLDQRKGTVFTFLTAGGKPASFAQSKRIISMFGEKAGIIVGKRNRFRKVDDKKVRDVVDKMASAHDLRRSFASRWALRVLPQVLQQMMRHADINTTMKYYVDVDSNNLGDVIYQAAEAANQAAEARAKNLTQRAG